MTETQQISRAGPDADARGATLHKSRSKKGTIVLLGVIIALVVLPTLWGARVALQLSRAPVSLVRPHDYEAALEQLLELQALALSEAEVGHKAFFVAYIGCAVPRVWQNKIVLENFKRMREKGVEVMLVGGRKGYQGEPLSSPAWPFEFHGKLMETLDLDKEGVDKFLRIREKGQYNYSLVAGSDQRVRAYIASHEEKNIYPTSYFTVTDTEVCQEWKRNLLKKALTEDNPRED